MSVELSNGETCPLRRGRVDVEFNNVVDDGGAEDDEVSNLIKKSANFPMTQSPKDRATIKRREQRFKCNICHHVGVCETCSRVDGAFR